VYLTRRGGTAWHRQVTNQDLRHFSIIHLLSYWN